MRNIDVGAVVWTTALLVLLSLCIYGCYNAFLHPLANYPGPKLRAVSRVPYLLGLISGKHHLIIKNLHDQYGGVVRIAPDKLSYISAEAWRDIYGHKKIEMNKDPKWYVPDPNADNIALSNREKHGHFRRLFSHGFSDRSLRAQEPLLRSYVDLLTEGLERYSNNGRNPLDMVQWYNWTTFDIIGDLTFGEPFGCLETASLHPWVRDIFHAIKGITYLRVCQEIPILGPYLPLLLSRVLSNKAVKKREAHLNYTREKVTRRLNNKDHRPDFMDNVLRQPEGKGLTFPEMLSNSSVLIVAGSETTATLLSGATYLLLTNPEKLQKLSTELLAAFNSPGDITIESASRLEYLPAVIEETLRFYSPVAAGLPRVTPAGGSQIEGKFVPAGTSVTVSHFAAYHSSKNFHRPDEFIPERFFNRSSSDKRDVLQPFSVGPRNCIGRNLAYAEAKLILASVVFAFDMKLSDDSLGWLDQVAYLVWQKHPLNVYLTPRMSRHNVEGEA